MTAFIFSFGVYSPSLIWPLSKSNCLALYGGAMPVNKTVWPSFFFSKPLNTSMGDASSYTVNVQDGSLIGFYGYPSTGQTFRLQ
jgi:hypothetical protein